MDQFRDRQNLIDRLTCVVSAYGGDQERWPAADRKRLEAFLAEDPEARHLVEQARAFDTLLDAADTAAPDTTRVLTDRLMARIAEDAGATATPAPTTGHMTGPTTGQVVAFPGGRRRDRTPRDQNEPRSMPPWMAVAAMAASLVLGIALGANGYLEQATEGVTELAALVGNGELSSSPDDVFAPLEEDFL